MTSHPEGILFGGDGPWLIPVPFLDRTSARASVEDYSGNIAALLRDAATVDRRLSDWFVSTADETAAECIMQKSRHRPCGVSLNEASTADSMFTRHSRRRQMNRARTRAVLISSHYM